MALPSRDSPVGRNLDVTSGRTGSTASGPGPAPTSTGPATTVAPTAPAVTTTVTPSPSDPAATTTTAAAPASATSPTAGGTTAPTTATTAPAEPLDPWTDPGDRTGLIRCDAALASKSVGGDTCNRPVPESLYRPLSFPRLRPGDPCPVTAAKSMPLATTSQVFVGDGLLRLFSVDGPGIVKFGASNQRYWDAYWGGQKVLFGLAPGLSAGLVRGRQLDGTAALGFGGVVDRGDAPVDEFHPASNPNPTWDTDVTSLRIRTPGCYGLQIDDASGTTLIVFRADGPDLGPPPPMPPA
jgi:hypothetical protein